MTPDDSADEGANEGTDETSNEDSQDEGSEESDASPNGKAELEKDEGEESGDSDSDADSSKDDADGDDADDEAESESDTDELTDEVLDDFSHAYGDRIMGTKAMQERVSKLVQSEVSKQVTSKMRGQTATSEREALVNRGRAAVIELTTLGETAEAELAKASQGEKFQAQVFDKDKYNKNLQIFGEAIKEDTRSLFEAAIEDGVNEVLTGSLASFVDAKQSDLTEIVRTHEMMRAAKDAQAEPKFMADMVQFIVDRATELGAQQERERSSKGKAVNKQIASSNAVKAATAKIQSRKSKPDTPKSKARKGKGGRGIAEYEEARDEGKIDLADEIFAEMMQSN
jgi:hypothetical protein